MNSSPENISIYVCEFCIITREDNSAQNLPQKVLLFPSKIKKVSRVVKFRYFIYMYLMYIQVSQLIKIV